eukprot:252656-Prymnesium_polylepis.1
MDAAGCTWTSENSTTNRSARCAECWARVSSTARSRRGSKSQSIGCVIANGAVRVSHSGDTEDACAKLHFDSKRYTARASEDEGRVATRPQVAGALLLRRATRRRVPVLFVARRLRGVPVWHGVAARAVDAHAECAAI